MRRGIRMIEVIMRITETGTMEKKRTNNEKYREENDGEKAD